MPEPKPTTAPNGAYDAVDSFNSMLDSALTPMQSAPTLDEREDDNNDNDDNDE